MRDGEGARLRELGFTNRSALALFRNGIKDEFDLSCLTEVDLICMSGVGSDTIKQAKEVLSRIGMSLFPEGYPARRNNDEKYLEEVRQLKAELDAKRSELDSLTEKLIARQQRRKDREE